MLLAYKFRLYPTAKQIDLLEQHFNATRFVYNKFLEVRSSAFNKDGSSISYNDTSELLTHLKSFDNFSWLRKINSQSLQASLKHLDSSFLRFFKKLGGYPNFKSRKHSKQSFNIPQSVKLNLDKNLLVIPKFLEGIKVKIHRNISNMLIKQATISRNCGKFYVSILVENHISPESVSYNSMSDAHKSQAVGLDLGLTDFIITSTGQKFSNKRFFVKTQNRLKRAQRKLSKKRHPREKGDKTPVSKNFLKQKVKVQKIHNKISNQRLDYLHKISNEITNHFKIICMESLSVKSLLKNSKLSKHIADVSWSKLIELIQYKSIIKGNIFHKIDKWFPSSQVCSNCGAHTGKKPLEIRFFSCPDCGSNHDRDINAAMNILKQGLLEIESLELNTTGAVEI